MKIRRASASRSFIVFASSGLTLCLRTSRFWWWPVVRASSGDC